MPCSAKQDCTLTHGEQPELAGPGRTPCGAEVALVQATPSTPFGSLIARGPAACDARLSDGTDLASVSRSSSVNTTAAPVPNPRKRPASQNPPRKIRARPERRQSQSDCLAAITRLREALANPL